MSGWVHLIKRVYHVLLAFYPSGFRAEFGEEMESVFSEVTSEAGDSTGKLAVFFLREIRDLPGAVWREHWFALAEKEVSMTTSYKKPGWFFYPGWVVLSTLAIPLAWVTYFGIISLVTRWVGDTIQVGSRTRVTEDYLFLYIFVPTLCLLTGLLQYILLRLYLPRIGWWILATGLGWLLAFAVLRWGLGATYDSTLGTGLTFPVVGGSIGLGQWFLLRRRLSHAAWWIVASVLGWGLFSLVGLTAVQNMGALAQLLPMGLMPAIATSFVWWILLKQPPGLERESLGV